jgi:hypothetical protein
MQHACNFMFYSFCKLSLEVAKTVPHPLKMDSINLGVNGKLMIETVKVLSSVSTCPKKMDKSSQKS